METWCCTGHKKNYLFYVSSGTKVFSTCAYIHAWKSGSKCCILKVKTSLHRQHSHKHEVLSETAGLEYISISFRRTVLIVDVKLQRSGSLILHFLYILHADKRQKYPKKEMQFMFALSVIITALLFFIYFIHFRGFYIICVCVGTCYTK